MSTSPINVALVISALSLSTYVIWRQRKTSAPLPPGPKGLPILGNIKDMAMDGEPWIKYRDMSREYDSDMIYLSVPGISMLIVNSAKVAEDLFEGRHALYSSRPRLPMLNEVLGWDWNFGLLPYGNAWKAARTLFMHQFQPAKLAIYQKPCIVESTNIFLNRLLESPERFFDHARYLAGRTIFSSAYGIDLEDERDPFIKTAEKAAEALSIAGIPGTFLVDSIPILKYIPSWMPGAKFQQFCTEYGPSVKRLPEAPMEFVKQKLEDGTAKPSIASRCIQEFQEDGAWNPENEKLLAKVLGVMYAAGSDTTASVVGNIVLVLAKNPDILRKGQAAVDAAVGMHRMPNFSDENRIPYVTAIMKEVFRWNPVVPLAIPHFITTPDHYNGYYIPANTMVIGNSWAILHDPVVYGPDPEVFRPERFLNEDGSLNTTIPDPDATFGFGRRVCAGRAMAQSAIWLAIAGILAGFDITNAIAEDGSKIEIPGDYINGLLSVPAPFKCQIRPRSEVVATMIRHSVEQ